MRAFKNAFGFYFLFLFPFTFFFFFFFFFFSFIFPLLVAFMNAIGVVGFIMGLLIIACLAGWLRGEGVPRVRVLLLRP